MKIKFNRINSIFILYLQGISLCIHFTYLVIEQIHNHTYILLNLDLSCYFTVHEVEAKYIVKHGNAAVSGKNEGRDACEFHSGVQSHFIRRRSRLLILNTAQPLIFTRFRGKSPFEIFNAHVHTNLCQFKKNILSIFMYENILLMQIKTN